MNFISSLINAEFLIGKKNLCKTTFQFFFHSLLVLIHFAFSNIQKVVFWKTTWKAKSCDITDYGKKTFFHSGPFSRKHYQGKDQFSEKGVSLIAARRNKKCFCQSHANIFLVGDWKLLKPTDKKGFFGCYMETFSWDGRWHYTTTTGGGRLALFTSL